jgi:hypothetical protein
MVALDLDEIRLECARVAQLKLAAVRGYDGEIENAAR